MNGKSRASKYDQFTLGYLVCAAQAARAGSDTLAVEMMREVGVRELHELNGKGLEAFDKSPLRRCLLLEMETR